MTIPQTPIVQQKCTVPEALRILDGSEIKTLFIIDDKYRLVGSLTDGDVRRYILRTGGLAGDVSDACNRDPFVVEGGYDREEVIGRMRSMHLKAAPVIDRDRKIVDFLIPSIDSDLDDPKEQTLANIPVVIMAGGKGTRLDPFTRILPKPLIPIGNQPVIEIIMNEFNRYGASKFFISVNHKARLIKAYFEDQSYPYQISFLEEEEPLGTAGALKMLEGTVSGDFFVSNCDVIIKSDFSEVLQFHRAGDYHLTIIAAMHQHAIPYGVCEPGEDGSLISITEKPEYSMLINTGVYILNSRALKHIIPNRVFHITDLIDKLKESGLRVGVYPVEESSYSDIGQWETYRKTLQSMM